jgi:DNA-binding LytR/AlgR family response regulator
MSDSPGPLAGRRVLIVEDQFLIADEMRRSVIALGGEAIGPCPSVTAARQSVGEQTPDVAFLDVNLRGENVFAFADELARLKVPFAFATGYDSWMIPPAYRDLPRMQKPVSPTALQEAIALLKLKS